MKEYAYKPQSEVYEGEVKIKVLKYKERLKLLKDKGFRITAEGTVEVGDGNQLDAAIQMAEIAEEYVSEVKLKRKDNNRLLKAFEDLEYDQDGVLLINELAGQVLAGVKLGKN